MKILTFNSLADCKTAIKKIDNKLNYPNAYTLTFDQPHKTIKGVNFINKPSGLNLANILSGIVFYEATINKSDIINELPHHLKVNENGLVVKSDAKYFILNKTENYKDKTIELTYSFNGNKFQFKIDVSGLTPTINGYTIDVNTEIKTHYQNNILA